jgi:hypothetical protein
VRCGFTAFALVRPACVVLLRRLARAACAAGLDSAAQALALAGSPDGCRLVAWQHLGLPRSPVASGAPAARPQPQAPYPPPPNPNPNPMLKPRKPHRQPIRNRSQKRGLRLMMTLTNFWEDYGGFPQYVRWVGGGMGEGGGTSG